MAVRECTEGSEEDGGMLRTLRASQTHYNVRDGEGEWMMQRKPSQAELQWFELIQ